MRQREARTSKSHAVLLHLSFQVRQLLLEARAKTLRHLSNNSSSEEQEKKADSKSPKENAVPVQPLSVTTSLGLRTLLDVLQVTFADQPAIAERLLVSLLRILEGLTPEALRQEPSEYLDEMQQMLETLAQTQSPLSGLVFSVSVMKWRQEKPLAYCR